MRFSNTFLLRKLHQITGVVPLGVFFGVHMLTNAKAMNGPKVFNDAVGDIHHLPFLLFIEIFGIFIPLLFHSIYGIVISGEARMNVGNYGYGRNWFYVLQRVTGGFLFFFILFHILNLRFGAVPLPGLSTTAVAGNADSAYQIVADQFKVTWVVVLYVLGVAATAWHLAYGLFLFAVDWGIVVGEKAQRYTLYASYAIALGLFLVGTNAAFSFRRPCGLLPQTLCEGGSKKSVVETPKPAKF